VDERQAFLAINNMLRLENLSAQMVKGIVPQLREIYKELQAQISRWPEGDIERQLRARQLLRQVQEFMRTPNQMLWEQIREGLGQEVANQVEWAHRYAIIGPTQEVNAAQRAVAAGMPGQYSAWVEPSQFTREMLVAITQDTEVLGHKLDRWFGDGLFGKSQVKRIDSIVKAGFLTGQTNEEIAKALDAALNRGISEARAIAQTAVMDMADKAHFEFWAANDDVIDAYRWDANFDYRVCPICAYWDGQERETIAEFPKTRVHPNCHCQILPITKAMRLLDDEGDRQMVVIGAKKDEAWKSRVERDGGTITRQKDYKTKVKVDGKRELKTAVGIRPGSGRMTMGDFLYYAPWETQVKVMGKTRAMEFMRMVQGDAVSSRDTLAERQAKANLRMSPEDALRRLIKKEGDRVIGWKPRPKRKGK
jgi:SPP1 gp7 family putative phage head morphogenesis protein